MRAVTTYHVESYDPSGLQERNISEVEVFLKNHLADRFAKAEDRNVPDVPIKALRRIKSGQFEQGDIEAFRMLVRDGLITARRKIEELREERARVPQDEMSKKAYDGLTEGLEDSCKRIERCMSDFDAAFAEAFAETWGQEEN